MSTEITIANATETLPSITNPIERAFACDNLLTRTIPAVQAAIAHIRRVAVYEATLRPGASAASVAEELGVSAKAVSKAVADQRAADRGMMADALTTLGNSGDATTRDVVVMASRLLSTKTASDSKQIPPLQRASVQRAVERAATIVDQSAY